MLDRSRRPLLLPFLAPAAALCFLFILYPIVQTAVSSFTNWYVTSDRDFIGLENFRELLADGIYWTALKNTTLLIAGGALVLFPLSLVIAHVTYGPGKGRTLGRLIAIAPLALTPVAAALIWKLALDPNLGLLNGALRSVGADSLAQPWLGQRWSAPIAVMLATVWWILGLYVVVFGAAMASIPSEIREAARVDGASGWTTFRHVTLPLIWGTARALLVLWAATAVGALAFIQVLTDGGPFRSTETVVTYLTKVAFAEARFGYAAAIAVTSTLLLLVVTALIQFVTRREEVTY